MDPLPPEVLARLAKLVRKSKTGASPRTGASPGRRFRLRPADIPWHLPVKEVLKRLRAREDGKPVPVTIDFQDGSPPVTVDLPLKKPRPPRNPGRPSHPLTVERAEREASAHPHDSNTQLAKRLSAALKAEIGPNAPPVTPRLVRRRRQEGDAERRRRSTKG
jgi:hypothetical protein